MIIPPLSPFPGRGAAPEDYIERADTVMQELPRTVAGIQAVSDAFNLGAGVLSTGYLPPVAYAAGITMKSALQTVQRGDTTYAPLLERLPFATTIEFDATAWRVVQGVTASELAEPVDAARLGLHDETVPAYQKKLRAMAAFGEPQRRALAQCSVARPSRTFINALLAGEVTIALANDSITEGADNWYVNAWVRNFTEMLRAQMPWIKWNIINLSLGGRSLGDLQNGAFTSPGSFSRPAKTGGLDSEVWPGGSSVAGKSWREYVRDVEPDLIIMAHQENMGEDTEYYDACWASFKSYTDTWAKRPWFCFAPTHLPTMREDLYDGALAAAQVGRQAIADYLRLTAMQNGYGLIDVNSQFRMLRDGRRTEVVPYQVERDFRYWGDQSEWQVIQSAAPTKIGSVMSFGNTSVIARVGATARDVDVCADVTPAAGAVFGIGYRGYKSFKSYSARYAAASGLIELYYGPTVIASVAVVPTGVFNFRVKATGQRHELYYNGVLVLSKIHGICTYHGVVTIGFPAGSGSVSGLFLSLAKEADVAPQYFNEEKILGTFPAALLTDPDSDGGDGVHHLSASGIFLVYLTAAQRFIEQIKGILDRPAVATSGATASEISSPTDESVKVIAGSTCRINLGVEQIGMAHVSFGYRNAGSFAGVLQLRVGGLLAFSWWLLPTPSGGQPQTFSISVPVLIPAGPVDVSIAWGGTPGGQPAMTSGGGGGSRTLAVSITPA